MSQHILNSVGKEIVKVGNPIGNSTTVTAISSNNFKLNVR